VDRFDALMHAAKAHASATDKCGQPYVLHPIAVAMAVAIIVKLADLWHNLSPARQGCLPAQEARSLEKRYLKTRDWLWEELGAAWWPA
jgi:(p)ppGpp synthase/HD superfamily hydrolase